MDSLTLLDDGGMNNHHNQFKDIQATYIVEKINQAKALGLKKTDIFSLPSNTIMFLEIEDMLYTKNYKVTDVSTKGTSTMPFSIRYQIFWM